MKRTLVVGWALALIFGAGPALAEPEEGWLGRPLAKVDFAAAPAEDPSALRSLAALTPGTPFSPLAVRRAVKALYQLGRFENVYAEGKLDENGQVVLLFSLPPRPVLRSIRLVQSEVLSVGDIEDSTRLVTGSPIDARVLPAKRAMLVNRLARLGYRQPAIGLALLEVDPNGGYDLVVRIDEGIATQLRKLIVKGRPQLPLRVIGDELELRPGDVIDLDQLEASLLVLGADYRRLGFLDAHIAAPVVRDLPDTRGGRPLADLVLDIDAGPEVSVRVKGNLAITTREILGDADILEELGSGPPVLTELRDRVLTRYEKRGYFSARVAVASRRTGDDLKKEVLISIAEGERGSVANIEFPGNTVLEKSELVARIHEAVRAEMSDDAEKPGASGESVSEIVGGRAVRGRAGKVVEPDSTAPDPGRVFVRRAYRTAADAIADMYRTEGYQRVEVGAPEVTARERGGLLDVEMPVSQGVKWVIGAISFSGNENVDANELFDLSGLDPTKVAGEPLAFSRVEDARRAIIDHYQNKGHLYISLYEELRQVPARGSLVASDYVRTSSIAPLDARRVCAKAEAEKKPSCDVELVFRINEGPEVRTRGVIIRGALITNRDVVEKQIEVDSKEVLKNQDMVDTRDNLLRVGVFERVTVKPMDESEVAAEKDVIIELKERKHLSLELGIGASTEEGVRAFASFADANLAGTALRFQTQLKANVWLPPLLILYNDRIRESIRTFYDSFDTFDRLEYELAGGLSYPRIFSLPPGFSAGLDLIGLRNNDPAFAENTQTGTFVVSYKGFKPTLIGSERQVAIQVRAGFERSTLVCNSGISDRPELCSDTQTSSTTLNFRPSGTTIYATFGPRVSWDLRNDPVDPSAGAYFEVGAELAKGFETGSPDFGRLEGRAQGFVPLGSRVVVALSFQAARILPFQSLDEGGQAITIPVNRRLFSGGRSTIRGYAEKTLLPQDTEILSSTGLPKSVISTGGLLSFAIKNELRFAVYGPLSLAVFYDVGDLFEGGVFRLKTVTALDNGKTVTRSLAQGAGVGVRVATPIGPLAVDFAVPISARDPGADGPQLHFAVGNF